MKNLLVLTDFSEIATHAAAYALRFAEKTKANISLCNAFQEPVTIPEMSGGMYFSANDYTLISDNSVIQLNVLKKFLNKQERNNDEAGGFQPQINLISSVGNLADVIKEVILQQSNELIIAGTHDKEGLGDILLGNNVKDLIRKINFPLLLIPFKTAFSEIKKIGFAIELQHEDIDITAIRKLICFAKPLHANILLLHIYNGQEKKFEAEKHLKKVLKAVINNDGHPHISFRFFDEKTIEEGLSEVCKSEDVDILAMVHQHHGFLSRVFRSGHTSKGYRSYRHPSVSFAA